MSERIPKESFAEQVKTKFRAQLPNLPEFELELTEVAEHATTAKQEQFSLYFLGPPEAPIYQGIYPLTHEQLGELQLFLVPIGRDQNGVQYEAVFNRFLK